MKKVLAIVNSISTILVLGINYLAQKEVFTGSSIGEISAKYDNLFTPASYAFAIWGFIFLNLIFYNLFQIRRAFFSSKDADFILQTGWWFAIANICTTLWVLAFTHDYTGLSVVIMFCILISLCMIIVRTNMERWDAPIEIIAFVWWPICFYSGWIAVATIANTAAYLVKINWNAFDISPEIWGIVMVTLAFLINLFLVFNRNMREFALVGIWALVAIFIRQRGMYDSLAYLSLAQALLLFIAIAIHGYKNRATNPVNKLKERLDS